MEHSQYRKILQSQDEMDKAKREELLRVYLQTPSLPKLQAARALLVELKNKLNRCNNSKNRGNKGIRNILYKKRTI